MFIRGDWFFVLLSLLTTAFMAKPYIYAMQQDNYRLQCVFKSKTIRRIFLVDMMAMLIFIGIYIGVSYLHSRAFWGFLVAMFFFVAETVLYFAEDGDKKKPLKYTKRAVRGFGAIILTETAVITAILFHLSGIFDDDNAFFRYAGFLIIPVFYPLVLVLTMSVANLFEGLNNRRYETKTKKALEKSDTLKIAITGSYGKTSVKNFLKHILAVKYHVLATPESYNTPMGISKTVKGLDLTHQIFIAEMGARRVGDIKRLMKIVQPDISVLTGINSQHLETFKTQDNLIKEKMQVATMLQESGRVVINGNLKGLIEDFAPQISAQIIYAGRENDQVFASDITLADDGCTFNLHFGDEVYSATTQLIGSHNVENIAVASSVAYALGISPKHIVERIATIEPVPHRLQLIQRDVINIIDDTFNGNPDGARVALETLDCFKGRKVVITPGLVELGDREKDENILLGERIGKVADVVVLIGGKRSEQLKHGLRDFQGEVLHFQTLKLAEQSFKDFIRIGDTILLLNDLPDVYEE